nr:410_t:CDS:10 [Entrophospora candida]
MSTNPNWVETLITENPTYKTFTRANRGYMVYNSEQEYEVLDLFANVKGENDHSINGYFQHKKTKNWIPLLPGHMVIGKFGGKYAKLSIVKAGENQLSFSWVIFEDIQMNIIINTGNKADFFNSFINEIKLSLSIPDILGFNDSNLVLQFQQVVNSCFPNVFIKAKKHFAAKKKIVMLSNSTKRKSQELEEEFLNEDDGQVKVSIKNGISFTQKGIDLTPKQTQALAIEYEGLKKEEKLSNIMKDAFETTNLGSTMLINSELYLGLVLMFPSKCHVCNAVAEFNNETNNSSFATMFAGSGLLGGVNRQQLETISSMLGITSQISNRFYYEKQETFYENIIDHAEISTEVALNDAIAYTKSQNKNVLPVSFDCSWSYGRNTNQASGEFIYQDDLPGYEHKPIIAFQVIEKSQTTTHQRNDNKENMLLDICVDGDLNSNKTLNGIHQSNILHGKIMKTVLCYYTSCVYAASMSKLDEEIITISEEELEITQIHGLTCHLSGDHSKCWEEVCWIKDNPDVELQEPHLLNHTPYQRNCFEEMLKACFYIPTKQNLITHIRTSHNEAFNRVKLCFLDKKIDFWKSFQTRHVLAVIKHNECLLELLQVSRLVPEFEALSLYDIENIKKLENNHTRQNKINVSNIVQRSIQRGKDFVPYGRSVQEKIKALEFEPSFAKHILDFTKILKCQACHAFKKNGALGLCCLCEYYLNYGLYDQLLDKGYKYEGHLIKHPPKNLNYQDVLTSVFGFDGFQENQEAAIKVIHEDSDVFVSIRTGGGKTLCYWMAALLQGGLTIVFSPLTALIDDQMVEMVHAGIPCSGLYSSTIMLPKYQEKIFAEIASGLPKILFITPEKFQKNKSFQEMLKQYNKNAPLTFIIDEAHCIKDWEYFRPELHFEIRKKSTKQKLVDDILIQLNDLGIGHAIIYCATIKLESQLKSLRLTLWKNGQIQIMIATNAFGLGINMSNVRLVIHYTFPISIGNLVQETGCAGHDGLSSRAILYYTRADLETIYNIVANNRESGDQENNEETTSDTNGSRCWQCDNYIRFQNESTICLDVKTDILKMIEVINEIIEFNRTTPLDKAELSTLISYNEKRTLQVKTKDEACHLLDYLVTCGVIKFDIFVSRPTGNSTYTSCQPIVLGIKEGATAFVHDRMWEFIKKKGVLGSGTGIILVITIICEYFEIFAKVKAVEGNLDELLF